MQYQRVTIKCLPRKEEKIHISAGENHNVKTPLIITFYCEHAFKPFVFGRPRFLTVSTSWIFLAGPSSLLFALPTFIKNLMGLLTVIGLVRTIRFIFFRRFFFVWGTSLGTDPLKLAFVITLGMASTKEESLFWSLAGITFGGAFGISKDLTGAQPSDMAFNMSDRNCNSVLHVLRS